MLSPLEIKGCDKGQSLPEQRAVAGQMGLLFSKGVLFCVVSGKPTLFGHIPKIKFSGHHMTQHRSLHSPKEEGGCLEWQEPPTDGLGTSCIHRCTHNTALPSEAPSQAHIEFSTVYMKTKINNLRKAAHVCVWRVQDKSGNRPRGIEDIWQVSASSFRFVIYGNLSISSLPSFKIYKDAQCPSHRG